MTQPEEPIHSTPAETTAELVAMGLSAVPYGGSVLSAIANSLIQKRQNRRLNAFLVSLAKDLNLVQDRMNQDFVKSEGFHDLAEDIFSKAAETRLQEKLDALRAIFLNTVISDRPSYDEAAEIAALVHGWQPRHVILLRILQDPRRANRQMGGPVGEGGGLATSIIDIVQKLLPEWEEDQIDRTWKELYDARIHRTPETKGMMNDTGIRQLENRLSEHGQKVSTYLTDPPEVRGDD